MEKRRWMDQHIGWVLPMLVGIVMAIACGLLDLRDKVMQHTTMLSERARTTNKIATDVDEIKRIVYKLDAIFDAKRDNTVTLAKHDSKE